MSNSRAKGLNIQAVIFIGYFQLQVAVVTDMSSLRQTTDKLTHYTM